MIYLACSMVKFVWTLVWGLKYISWLWWWVASGGLKKGHKQYSFYEQEFRILGVANLLIQKIMSGLELVLKKSTYMIG